MGWRLALHASEAADVEAFVQRPGSVNVDHGSDADNPTPADVGVQEREP
jgi:hypothetical protein